MTERYRPGYFPQVKAFAASQPEFDYLRAIIRAHTEDRSPGGIWIWKERSKVAAICGMAYPNADDAWLYGMRVDDRFKGKGIATRLTRELFRVAAASGRTWVGLDTLNHPRKAPIFRITEKLGMKLEGIHGTACFGDLPRRFKLPRPVRMEFIFAYWQTQGIEVMLHQCYPRWIWSRLMLERARRVDREGFFLDDVPAHIVRAPPDQEGIRRTVINAFDRPADFRSFLSAALGFAVGPKRSLVIHHPAKWTSGLETAARRLVPGLRRRKNCDFTAWRIYGKDIKAPDG
jgi:GNAT superfamily N-acetyltransferase